MATYLALYDTNGTTLLEYDMGMVVELKFCESRISWNLFCSGESTKSILHDLL